MDEPRELNGMRVAERPSGLLVATATSMVERPTPGAVAVPVPVVHIADQPVEIPITVVGG